MALQMLIENAVKHNMANIEKPLKIDLWLNVDYIIVQNNLQPKRTNTSSNKIGLKNIQSQYRYLSKKEVIIERTDDFFTVKLPILNSI
jgi:two-component system, LytTR family, sensor kinase